MANGSRLAGRPRIETGNHASCDNRASRFFSATLISSVRFSGFRKQQALPHSGHAGQFAEDASGTAEATAMAAAAEATAAAGAGAAAAAAAEATAAAAQATAPTSTGQRQQKELKRHNKQRYGHMKLINTYTKPGMLPPTPHLPALVPTLLTALLVMNLTGCITEPEAEDPGTKEEEYTPPPVIQMEIGTDDAVDLIEVTSDYQSNYSKALVGICLVKESAGQWAKSLGVNQREANLDGAEGYGNCRYVSPGQVNLYFWKAKLFGVMTEVGDRQFDFTNYGGHKVYFKWHRD